MRIDGAAVAIGAQNAQTRQELSTAVLAKVNEAAKQQGEAALSLLDSAVETTQGHGHGGSSNLNVTA